MTIQPKVLNVSLTGNQNLNTSINTKTHLGVLYVNEPKNYQARLVGIKGDTGSIGEQGLRGEPGPPGASGELYAQYTKDPTGFVDRVDSKMSFDDATRTFKIEPSINGGSYIYFIAGIQYTINTPITIQIPNIQGIYFIYFDLGGNVAITSELSTVGIVASIAIIGWDVDDQISTFFGEERHGISMDWQTHYYLHETVGCQWTHGLDISYIPNGNGTTNDELKISLSNGIIYDEDLRHSIVNGIVDDLFVQKLTPTAQLPVWHRLGAAGNIKHTPANDYPFKMGINRIQYNNYNDTTLEWELLETDNNKYCAMWIFATNDIKEPIVSVMGQYTENTLDEAMLSNTPDTLNISDVFPTPEFKLLYRIIYFVKNSFTNTFNATISSITDYRADGNKTTSNASISNPGLMPATMYSDLLNATDSATANTLAERDASGNASFNVLTTNDITITNAPLNPTDGVNKQYVEPKLLPIGGLYKQKLVKSSNTDYEVEWVDEEDRMKKIIDEVDETLMYIGISQPGSDTSASVWAIKKLDFIGEDIYITWAESVNSFTKIWDNRATYVYG